METRMVINIKTKNKIKAWFETGDKDKPFETGDITKDVHSNVISCIKNFLDRFENDELPEDFDDGYVEGMDEPKDYGIRFKITLKKSGK